MLEGDVFNVKLFRFNFNIPLTEREADRFLSLGNTLIVSADVVEQFK